MVAVEDARSVLPGIPSALVATQTHEIGVIVPPPDIRAILDKTAQFVAKNGEKMAQVIITAQLEEPFPPNHAILNTNSPPPKHLQASLSSNGY